jgi:4-hydroxy-tetrahydrodipicolinate synthase
MIPLLINGEHRSEATLDAGSEPNLPQKGNVMKFERTPWEGCIPAVVTPFTESGDINTDAYCENIKLFLDEGVGGITPTGHNGEEWAVSHAEKKQLWSLARKVVDESGTGVPVIAGIDAVSTSDLIEEANLAAECGADGVMITPPFYVADATEAELYERYSSVATSVPIKLVVYNNPRRTTINMTPEFIGKLAEIDSVAAIKESYRDFVQMSETIRCVGNKARVYPGPASFIFPSVMLGAKGYISTGPDLLGQEGVNYYHYILNGDYDKVRPIHNSLVSIYSMLNKVGTWPASLKVALDLIGKHGGYPRKPVHPLGATEAQEVKDILLASGVTLRESVAS